MKPPTARPRTAAITGAGSGLGREIALKLAAKGYQVFGTALHDDEVHDLSARRALGIEVIAAGDQLGGITRQVHALG